MWFGWDYGVVPSCFMFGIWDVLVALRVALVLCSHFARGLDFSTWPLVVVWHVVLCCVCVAFVADSLL